jgi:hypothetical protein
MRNMHTIVLLATPLLLAAQQGTSHTPDRNTKHPFGTLTGHPGSTSAERSEVITLWTENFENGLDGWIVETPYGDVGWELTSTGNTEGYTPGPLEGTSGYPGGQWIMADSDAGGTAGVPENTRITSPPILGFGSMHYMMLRFEQSFRQLNDDQTLVKVSGDGGDTWTTYPVNQDVAGHQSTPGAPAAEVITLNISNALALGSDDIRIRFEWISDEGYTYSWQVDEVALLAAQTNDLALIKLDGEEHATGTGYYGMPCTVYPVGETHELTFKGEVINNGGATQTNVRLRAEVTGPDGYLTTHVSEPVDLAPAQGDSLFLPVIEMPDVIGDYQFVFSVIQDQQEDNTADNIVTRQIRVDPQVFGRDGGTVESARDNDGDDYELGNRFWISGYPRTLQGVDVALGPGTQSGALITAMVYDRWNQYVASSDLYTVAAADINAYGEGNFINLPLLEALELESEEMYMVCVRVQTDYGNVFTGISGTSEPQFSLIRPEDANMWYYTTSTPMVRMRLEGGVGFADEHLAPIGLQAFPSPFDDQTTVSFSNGQSGEVQWELRDATGRLARTGNMGTLAPGEHRILLDGEGLEAGLYMMTVETGGVRSTVKLVHQARR